MRIAGCGCALADYLYTDVDFNGPDIAPYLSRESGDGGISPGKLIFCEALESFAGKPYTTILQDIADGRPPDRFNVGGPSIVALILAAQLLTPKGIDVDFFGALGNDQIGAQIREMVKRTPLNISHLETREAISPFTLVLNDRNFDNGYGERAFINNIGAAGKYLPEDLPETFFEAEIVLFGATALVPGLHDGLTALLRHAKDKGCITVVSTVYDFRNEQRNPGQQWPLGDSQEGWPFVDLLIADAEEALRLSNAQTLDAACARFIESGCGAFAITHGPNPVRYYSGGEVFAPCSLSRVPVSSQVTDRLQDEPERVGDTTGCGDNFAGGVIASLAAQLDMARPGTISMHEAVATGIVSGGHACFQMGGIVIEDTPGQQLTAVCALYEDYRQQVRNDQQLGPCCFDQEE